MTDAGDPTEVYNLGKLKIAVLNFTVLYADGFMKITPEQFAYSYEVAVKVFDGRTTLRDGVNKLVLDAGLNSSSARTFIDNYRRLLQGEVFKRTMSASAMEYFLQCILRDKGREALASALQALRKHITYYENQYKGRANEMRNLLSNFQVRIDPPIDYDQMFQELMERVADSSAGSREARLKRLETASKKPTPYSAVVTAYRRNPDVIAEVLYRAQGRCERCDSKAPFISKAKGEPYLEVHHKVQLAHGGDDCLDNAIALCPNCHRELHFGA